MIIDKQTLREAIESYGKRTTLTTEIDEFFIPLAESRIGRTLKAQENYVSLDDLVPVTNPFTLPDRFGRIDAVTSNQAGGTRGLSEATRKTINRYNETGGQPLVFIIRGFEMEVRPGPVGSLRLDYWEQPQLTDDASTNDVLLRYPQLYLYGALVELYVWTKDFSARDAAIQFFLDEVKQINRNAARSVSSSPAVQRA